MQHQFWVTKKSVLRKLGGKEDECIVSSDAELDAKLELFKSINDSCVDLQRIIDLYQERLCYLAQEENALGRYLKECGKKEKNNSAGQIMATAGKALAYTGHQRLTVRAPLVRLHQEVETFRARAITDTKVTLSEMEKVRTEYRAALSWMKSASAQLDPDTGYGLDQFRKSQSYVKSAKVKFDRLTLACLQKVDLLAAARCNMFSHALVPYQNSVSLFSTKAVETLNAAFTKLDKVEPYDFSVCTELAISSEMDKDKNTFFNAEYTDKEAHNKSKNNETGAASKKEGEKIDVSSVANLLGEDFSLPDEKEEENSPTTTTDDATAASAELLDLSWQANLDYLMNDFLPSQLMQENNSSSFMKSDLDKNDQDCHPNGSSQLSEVDKPVKSKGNSSNQVSWLSLFAELDPLANQEIDKYSGDAA